MKCTPRLARMMLVALVFGGMVPSPGAQHDAHPPATERVQYTPAAVVPALGLRG